MNFVSGDPRVGGAHMTKWVGAIGEAGAARAVESINARNEANISKLYWRMQDRLQDSMTRRYRGLQKTAGKAFLSKKHPDWETKLQFGSNKYRYQLDPRTGRRVRALTQFEEKALMYPMYKQKLREAKLRQMYATTDADYLVAADEYKSLKKGMSRAKSSSKGFNINIGSTIRNLPTVREADALVENKERYLAKMHLRKQIMISQMIASGALNEKEIKSLKF